MAKVLLLLSALIVLQTLCKAAPNKNSHPIITSSIEEEYEIGNEENSSTDNDASQNQRQKRFYDLDGFGFSPYDFPSAYIYPSNPHYSKRDDSQNTGVYGSEETSLSLILRRLQEIVTNVRQKNVAQSPQTPIAAYIPFLYIPQVDCGCPSNGQNPSPTVDNPIPQPTVSTNDKMPLNGTMQQNITLDDRAGIDDKRQNWGVLVNRTVAVDISDDDDGSRPINFNPVIPEEPINIPVPPVEHGSVQAGMETAQTSKQFPSRRNPNASDNALSVNNNVQSNSSPDDVPLSLCDGAILSCCMQNVITFKCFQLQGCENPSVYGKPCDPEVQSMVIDKFQKFHKRRAG